MNSVPLHGAWWTATLVSAALGLTHASVARAHEPAHGVALGFAQPTSETPEVVLSNRGLVFVDGSGSAVTASLRCSAAYGASTATKLSVLPAQDGWLLGLYNGVLSTADRGCSVQTLGEGLPDLSLGFVVSVADDLLVPTRSLEVPSAVYASSDGGATWTERYANADQSYFNDLVVAPSDPNRLYAAGVATGESAALSTCGVSEDAGQNWTVHELAAGVRPFAVDPADPDVVFAWQPVDALGTTFRVLRSDDACVSFESVLEDIPEPAGVTGSADSTVRFIGALGTSGRGGLYRSMGPDEPFERVLEGQVQAVTCLVQRSDRLWLCANVAPNTNGVFTSDDAGETFEPFLTMEEVESPVACESAEARTQCAGAWYDFYSELHPEAYATPDAGAAPDAGMDGAVVDAGGEADGGRVGDAGGEAAAPEPASGGGCGLAPRRALRGGGGAWWLLVLVGAWLRLRRPPRSAAVVAVAGTDATGGRMTMRSRD